ncbi:hypothetical protein, partial [Streptomyces sp. NPDC127123]|uniref:hypothetical protein n=1 Tax=Streptomyces sp. NPDC127123 TaxID=3345372 RepID=UPI0036424647
GCSDRGAGGARERAKITVGTVRTAVVVALCAATVAGVGTASAEGQVGHRISASDGDGSISWDAVPAADGDGSISWDAVLTSDGDGSISWDVAPAADGDGSISWDAAPASSGDDSISWD